MKNFYDGSVGAEFNQPDDINDVRHTSTLAKFEEAVRKDERSRISPVSETLKPCPFCGGDPEKLWIGTRYRHGSSEKEPAVLCPKCEFRGPLKNWNTRTSDLAQCQKVPVDIERLTDFFTPQFVHRRDAQNMAVIVLGKFYVSTKSAVADTSTLQHPAAAGLEDPRGAPAGDNNGSNRGPRSISSPDPDGDRPK